MNRREFLAIAASSLPAAKIARAAKPPRCGCNSSHRRNYGRSRGHGHTVKTLAYNDQIPGSLLRMPEGKKVTVDVVNNTHLPELVHWHGFHISPEMDGTHEECAPHVQAGDSRRYSFTAQPASTRWYHIHGMAGQNTRIGMCSGQVRFGNRRAKSE